MVNKVNKLQRKSYKELFENIIKFSAGLPSRKVNRGRISKKSDFKVEFSL